jgi:lipopolysaccharide/colanic/teichoic acid biosynthesis glycosyltransferase
MERRSLSRWILFADLLWAVAALMCAGALRNRALPRFENWNSPRSLLPFLVATLILWVFLSGWMKLDCFRGGWHFPAVLSHLFLAVSSLMCVLLAGGYLADRFVSRLTLGYFGGLLFLGFVAIRCIAHSLLVAKYRSGKVRRAVIVGSDRIAKELGLKIHRHPEILCKVVGFLCPEDDLDFAGHNSKDALTVPALGAVDVLSARQVTDVIFAVLNPSLPEILNFAGSCRERHINVSFVPQPYELYLSKPALLDLDGIPVLELHEGSASDLFFRWKRLLDMLFGSALTLVSLPLLLPAAIGLRRSRGKAFRWEIRCGIRGKTFSMLRLNVDRGSSETTPFERLLATVSITELPQLWNVLRGDMSLVGPRPESPDRVRRYSEWQQQRLSTKPGMTGLAQVHGLRDQNSSEEKTRFDLQYILNPSLVDDVSILLQTFWTLAMRLVRYPYRVTPESDTPRPAFVDEIIPEFVKETFQHAHRSQSSAD